MVWVLNVPLPGEHVLVTHDSLSEYREVGCTDKNPGMRIEIALLPMDKMEHPSEEWDVLICDSYNQHWALKKVSGDDFVPATCNIVLPTAGRPVFIKLPEDPDMGLLDTISGIVRWAQKDRDGNYSFAMYLESYCQLIADGTASEYLQRFTWDEKRACWNICNEEGRPAILKSGRVEVAFG